MAEIGSLPKKLSAGLYVVATPIGNLGDISTRAKDVLATVDIIACEDTRVTAKLLNAYLIKKPLMPYHEHNGATQRPKLLEKMKNGGSVALVSDAGTPLISDPGYKLVDEARNADLSVTACPGPSALITALSIAGLPTNRFLFLGFAPNKSKARLDWFSAEENTNASLIFYENAKRLPSSLADAAKVFDERPGAVCRELTKKFEEVVRNNVSGLAAHYASIGPPKGEVVVIIGAPSKTALGEDASAAEVDRALKLALKHMSVKSASSFISELMSSPRNHTYARALELAQTADE